MRRWGDFRLRAVMLCGAVWVISTCAACGIGERGAIVIGSKNFSEQALLAEILAQQVEAKTQLQVVRRFYLAGTFICQQALLAGRIDAYVEYTGTALTAVLHDPVERNAGKVLARVREDYRRRYRLEVLPPLGFDNTFAIVVRGEDARRLGLRTISDAAREASKWRAGFGYEFMERPDGFEGLARVYGLKFVEPPRILDLGLLYRALLDKQVDLVAGNSTDGLLAARDLKMLEDDEHYFPPYEAVPIAREEMFVRHPEVRAAIEELAGKISDAEMQKMNYAVEGEHKDIQEVAREFLRATGLH